jgi:peptidyl-prolyl cis-trans isomerase SurA
LKEALAALDVGGTTEPERVVEGFQIVAICAKTEIAGQTEATLEVREELTQERGQLLARRYLRDLRSDAVIEYR